MNNHHFIAEIMLKSTGQNASDSNIKLYKLYKSAALFAEYLEAVLDYEVSPQEINKYHQYIRVALDEFKEVDDQ